MNVGDDGISSGQAPCEAVTGFSVVPDDRGFRVLTIRTVALDLDFPRDRARCEEVRC